MSHIGSTSSRRRDRAPSGHAAPPVAAGKPFRWLSTSEGHAVVISTLVKAMLFQAYHSTDFEVHRNWLAITHSLPMSEWYYDTTSEWTLDYPPFFAYFERVLAVFAYIVDPQIVQLANLDYKAWSVVAFQRSTVIVSEFVLVAAAFQWARRSQKPDYPTAFIIALSIVFHPGLLIVDHIHFQYNGMMLGILLWSIIAARSENMYACAALFATLLNFKHIFIYLAPPYFIFLLRRHCFSPPGAFQFDCLVELGAIVVSITALSFGPFVLAGGLSQLPQIISRLFPFQRGLNHAYWAANAWALVSGLDRLLVKYLVHRGWPISPAALVSASRGLVGTTTFGVLPAITPTITLSLTLGFSVIFLTRLWFDPSYKRFLNAVVLSAMTSFLWGWHVHEKAVLLFLIPMGLAATESDTHLRAYFIASTAGIYSLFPLLIKSQESPIKIIFSLLWGAMVFPALRRVVYRPSPNLLSWLVDKVELLYLSGFLLLQLYVGFLHHLIFPPPPHWYWSIAAELYPNSTAVTTTLVSEIPASTAFAVASSCIADSLTDTACTVLSSTVLASASLPSPTALLPPLVEAVRNASEAVQAPVAEGTMEFLPLMLTSVYCAGGIGWAWLRLMWTFMVD